MEFTNRMDGTGTRCNKGGEIYCALQLRSVAHQAAGRAPLAPSARCHDNARARLGNRRHRRPGHGQHGWGARHLHPLHGDLDTFVVTNLVLEGTTDPDGLTPRDQVLFAARNRNTGRR